MAIAKEELHQLIEDLPEKEIPAVRRYLQFLVHLPEEPKKSFAEHLANPEYDDEPWTEEDEKDTQEARADIAAGRTIPWDQLQKELGLS